MDLDESVEEGGERGSDKIKEQRKTEDGIHKMVLRRISKLREKRHHLNRTTHVPRLRLHSQQGSENLHFKISDEKNKK